MSNCNWNCCLITCYGCLGWLGPDQSSSSRPRPGSRRAWGYHLPCHTLSSFLRHPPPPIIYPSCLSLPPRCCSILSTIVGPIYHPPVLSIVLLPHATLFSAELHCLQLFLVPLPATRLSHYVCIPSCPSVVSFRPSVCVCPSAFLLPRLVTCLHYVYIY